MCVYCYDCHCHWLDRDDADDDEYGDETPTLCETATTQLSELTILPGPCRFQRCVPLYATPSM